jgi:hypothetical protein
MYMNSFLPLDTQVLVTPLDALGVVVVVLGAGRPGGAGGAPGVAAATALAP